MICNYFTGSKIIYATSPYTLITRIIVIRNFSYEIKSHRVQFDAYFIALYARIFLIGTGKFHLCILINFQNFIFPV